MTTHGCSNQLIPVAGNTCPWMLLYLHPLLLGWTLRTLLVQHTRCPALKLSFTLALWRNIRKVLCQVPFGLSETWWKAYTISCFCTCGIPLPKCKTFGESTCMKNSVSLNLHMIEMACLLQTSTSAWNPMEICCLSACGCRTWFKSTMRHNSVLGIGRRNTSGFTKVMKSSSNISTGICGSPFHSQGWIGLSRLLTWTMFTLPTSTNMRDHWICGNRGRQ